MWKYGKNSCLIESTLYYLLDGSRFNASTCILMDTLRVSSLEIGVEDQ